MTGKRISDTEWAARQSPEMPQLAAHVVEFYRYIARAFRGSDEAIYAGQRLAFYYKVGA